ncbi:MAG TPA: type II toxin-antitoxin system HicA family toxin [Candidatus Thermoplasmatota archaeon]|nr:type II toxin-antitoxin system HicA family toxin [Candidatus Thermoplasmatota archaeon]
MTRLRPLPYRRVARVLRRLGFVEVRQRGSHVIFQHADGRITVVPHHAGEDIGVGLLRQIVRDARVSTEAFVDERRAED